MDDHSEALTWGEEAALLSRVARDQHRPEWMPSREEINAYLLDIRGPRIIVVGSSDWEDKRSAVASIRRALKYLDREAESATLIHGAAEGADRVTAGVARRLGMSIEAHSAVASRHSESCPRVQPTGGGCWTGRGICKEAGSQRSREMISSGADILIALLGSSESAEAAEGLELWLSKGRPAIICRQSKVDGAVSGEFLNMDRWQDQN